MKSIYEFITWSNCGNNCKFCWQKHLNDRSKFLTLDQKHAALESILSFLNSDKFISGNHVLLVGGELFDSVGLEDSLFVSFFDEILAKVINDQIDLLYLNTNLLYKNLDVLKHVIRTLEVAGVLHRLKFTTSYDLDGRFKTEADRQLMLSNLKYLTAKYENLNTVVNVILTKVACEQIIDGSFSIKSFKESYRVDVNTIPYITLLEEMRADKPLVMNALLKIESECGGYIKSYVDNFDLKQDRHLFEYTAGDINGLVECDSDTDGECGHSVNFKRCFDDGSCFVCEMKRLCEETY